MSVTADTLDHAAHAGQAGPAENHAADRFVDQALTADKREGQRMAEMARWVALAVIGVLLPILNPRFEVLYYEGLLLCFAGIGLLKIRLGRVGRSRPEVVLILCDLALLTVTIVVPNPLGEENWPVAMQYRFVNFHYFYVLLAGATLAYSWRTLVAMGVWTTALWFAGLAWILLQPVGRPELSDAVLAALGGDERLLTLLDPNRVDLRERIEEVVVFMIVAGTLALGVWRSRRLLLAQAATERERTNLARYFSPNVVEELSQNDEPLKQTRTQDIAVLFVDIVGFTDFADARTPQEAIRTLREFHGRMERCVFAHHGTLDKYLGDGLMATFGTPYAGDRDAGNALACARAMIAEVNAWNGERRLSGEPPIVASFGLHYGEAVLGNIGANRLEFAVIGSTVNVASRLETLTRALGAILIASGALVERTRSEPGLDETILAGLAQTPPQPIRGVAEPVPVWTLSRKWKG
jgi:adenylate cyclase